MSKITKQAADTIASLINDRDVADMMLADDKADDKYEATITLAEEFGIELPGLTQARQWFAGRRGERIRSQELYCQLKGVPSPFHTRNRAA